MFRFQFPAGKITAALLFASKQDIRYYLNGVMFTKAPDGAGVLAVATDGHRLCAIYHAQDVAALPDFQVIIPRDELEAIARQPIKAGREPLELVLEVTDGHVTMRGAVTVECAAIDGKFPDWQKVVPAGDRPVDEKSAGSACGLNAAYLGDYAKAYKALGGRANPCIRMEQRTDGCANLITLSGLPDFLSVLMSAREDAPTLPEWMQAPAPVEEERIAA